MIFNFLFKPFVERINVLEQRISVLESTCAVSKKPIKTQELSEDELFEAVLAFINKSKFVSSSQIQRHFQIGYNRAARMIDSLQEKGFCGSQIGSNPRHVNKSAIDNYLSTKKI